MILPSLEKVYDAINTICQRIKNDYKERQALISEDFKLHQVAKEDQCRDCDFEVDRALFPVLKSIFEADGIECNESSATHDYCDWVMYITLDPKDMDHPVPANW